MAELPHIVFAWEMGANYGHATKITGVASALSGRARVTILARDVLAIGTMAPDLDVALLPAPHIASDQRDTKAAFGQNYAGVLLQEGWRETESLGLLTSSWLNLLGLLQPDVVVAQAAPTALLAARIIGLPAVLLGSGYDCPPRARPMPCYAPGNAEAERIADEQEALSLANANKILATRGAEPLEAFCDLLHVDLTLLTCLAETDHFAPRDRYEPDHPPYLGQIVTVDTGVTARWIGSGKPKIMAYLRRGSPQTDVAVSALAQIAPDHDIILSVPGIDAENRDKLIARGVQVFDKPVRLDQILPECDLGISHASNGVGAAFVQYGVPQIGLPTHREQMLFGQAIARAGLALGIAGTFGAKQVVEVIARALASQSMRKKARSARDRIAASDLPPPTQACADAILTLLN